MQIRRTALSISLGFLAFTGAGCGRQAGAPPQQQTEAERIEEAGNVFNNWYEQAAKGGKPEQVKIQRTNMARSYLRSRYKLDQIFEQFGGSDMTLQKAEELFKEARAGVESDTTLKPEPKKFLLDMIDEMKRMKAVTGGMKR
jgi:hypothetical protein